MARKSGRRVDEDSMSGWFRQAFTEKPEWIKASSNKGIKDKWIAEHPPHTEMPKNVQYAMASVKSQLRRGRRKGRGRKKSLREDSAGAVASRPKGLQLLAENIDECMIHAWNLDRVKLRDVIRLLRKARNEVVLKGGD